mmetsp:Transcript_42119/g.119117  ORF Transcript_42119/g.119117 Transcript_42119/m.119117 type:complete len:238 (-) Transcript_42119:30-743(-)
MSRRRYSGSSKSHRPRRPRWSLSPAVSRPRPATLGVPRPRKARARRTRGRRAPPGVLRRTRGRRLVRARVSPPQEPHRQAPILGVQQLLRHRNKIHGALPGLQAVGLQPAPRASSRPLGQLQVVARRTSTIRGGRRWGRVRLLLALVLPLVQASQRLGAPPRNPEAAAPPGAPRIRPSSTGGVRRRRRQPARSSSRRPPRASPRGTGAEEAPGRPRRRSRSHSTRSPRASPRRSATA